MTAPIVIFTRARDGLSEALTRDELEDELRRRYPAKGISIDALLRELDAYADPLITPCLVETPRGRFTVDIRLAEGDA